MTFSWFHDFISKYYNSMYSTKYILLFSYPRSTISYIGMLNLVWLMYKPLIGMTQSKLFFYVGANSRLAMYFVDSLNESFFGTSAKKIVTFVDKHFGYSFHSCEKSPSSFENNDNLVIDPTARAGCQENLFEKIFFEFFSNQRSRTCWLLSICAQQ